MAKKIDESVVRQIRDILQSAGYRNPTRVDLENNTVFEKNSKEGDFSHITDPFAKALLEDLQLVNNSPGTGLTSIRNVQVSVVKVA